MKINKLMATIIVGMMIICSILTNTINIQAAEPNITELGFVTQEQTNHKVFAELKKEGYYIYAYADNGLYVQKGKKRIHNEISFGTVPEGNFVSQADKLALIQMIYPTGSIWNESDYYTYKGIKGGASAFNSASARACGAFSMMVSDSLCGDSKGMATGSVDNPFYDNLLDKMFFPGDIGVNNTGAQGVAPDGRVYTSGQAGTHAVVIMGISGNQFVCAEGNADGLVVWGTKYDKSAFWCFESRKCPENGWVINENGTAYRSF